MGDERASGRIIWVSTVVLCLEAALALVGSVVYGQTQESPNAGGNYALGVLALPVLAAGGACLAVAVSAAFVLPVVRLSSVLARKFGRHEAWWVPVVVATVLATLSAAAAGAGAVDWVAAVGLWSAATVGLSVPALLGRLRRRRLVGPVVGWGMTAVIGVGVLGAVALQTNIIEAYRPPLMSPAALVGTWSDGDGATLTFTADGSVIASGVKDHELDENFDTVAKACTGEGTWTYEPGDDAWLQEVSVDLPACQWSPWNVGGTQERTTLYQYIGDPDSWDLYSLSKT
ncbi:hypothetical protein H9Y04_05230 [Streptomyces sp. TRM66268-LWL]|uniref:Sulfite exporter TauE/SafE family protein n=1 Tax=Streptomyces polyasparticus TaxID=2767826 RepID=A0ABR7SBU5_9ACTN|nr:hypothetical protein [Streptomyces polyasparticus]MBC9711971.1 hypothetical protein [Streptomyces polyasparticus]